jgi:hypothetical protein
MFITLETRCAWLMLALVALHTGQVLLDEISERLARTAPLASA